jgi:esterase
MQRLFSSITTNGVNPFRERFPLAEFKYVPGAGHWVHSQKPKEFLDLLLPFLQ